MLWVRLPSRARCNKLWLQIFFSLCFKQRRVFVKLKSKTLEILRSPPWLGWPLWNICVTNDHEYVPLVVNTSRYVMKMVFLTNIFYFWFWQKRNNIPTKFIFCPRLGKMKILNPRVEKKKTTHTQRLDEIRGCSKWKKLHFEYWR
jgi:hypothetical protein